MRMIGFASQDAQKLAELLEKQQYAKAHARLNQMKEVMQGEDATLCLTAALYSTPNLFAKVLHRCKAGQEYGGQLQLTLREGVDVTVSGTLPVLAAAMNKPEHLRILLDAGYDCNSAGTTSAMAFLESGMHWMSQGSDCGDCCGLSGNRMYYAGKATWSLTHLTPLAAAVACGSVEAVSALMRRKEVWKAESGIVCRAAVSALQVFQEDSRQIVAGMVFRKKRNFNAEALLHTCDLQIEYSADFCPAEWLEAQIEGGFCDEVGGRRILQTLEQNQPFRNLPVRARIRKLDLMERKFPELCREPWVAGIVLREILRRFANQKPYQKLLERWKRLSGEEGDLSWAHIQLARFPRPQLRALLDALGNELPLAMDADACTHFCKEDKGELMELLTHVRLHHNRGLEGISVLARTLAEIGDLRYLRKAVKLGAFVGEDPKALLEHLHREKRDDLRALVLTYSNRSQEENSRWKMEYRPFWSRYWEPGEPNYERWLQELVDEELPDEECLARLQVMDAPQVVCNIWQSRIANISQILTGSCEDRAVSFDQPMAAVCCGLQTRPLELVMRYMPKRLEQTYTLDFGEDLLQLEGTPLALAAAAGRTAQVQLLLDSGIQPDEVDRGVISMLKWVVHPRLPITPLMAAIYYGQEETAKQLLNAGAVCDFTKPLFQKLLVHGNEKTLEVASHLPNVGFESLSPEWLESIRENGEERIT